MFKFKGEVIHAGIHYPESWYDRKLEAASCLISSKRTEQTPDGMSILGDSSFSVRQKSTEGKTIQARKTVEKSIFIHSNVMTDI